jgi:hypothetical protein
MSASLWGEPMRSKGLGWTLAALGVVLVAAGLVLMLAIVPSMKKMPSDTNVTREYTGTMPVLFNPQTFQFMRNLPITLERHFAVVKTSGNVALVKEERTMTSDGKQLEQIVEDYAIDRSTMMATDTYPSDWAQTEGFWPRQGIVISWPIGSQKKTYPGWSDDYRGTVPLTYAGEMTYSRSGTKVYLYTSSSGPKPIDPAEVKALGLPTELPKTKLTALVGAAQMSPLVVQMLPSILKGIPGANVPLGYTYEYTGKYWIDPTTGIIIDTQKHELRKVGLSDAVIAKTPLALLGDAQKAAMRVPVSDYTYQATDASVQAAKKDAQDKGSDIRLFGTTLPWIGIGVGAALLLLGGFVVIRRSATA